MLQLFTLLYSGIVVTMGPCGFIPVQLSIFSLCMEPLIPLFKLSTWNWFQSLRTGPVACLKWMIVDWIVVSVRLSVSYLIVFAILTDPPISVVGNNIWASCSVTIIQFLVIIFSSGVAICDASSRLSRRSKKYFAVTALIFLLIFLNIFACVLFNCFARNYTIIFFIFSERNLMIFLAIFLSPIFSLLWGCTITIDVNGQYVFEI